MGSRDDGRSGVKRPQGGWEVSPGVMYLGSQGPSAHRVWLLNALLLQDRRMPDDPRLDKFTGPFGPVSEADIVRAPEPGPDDPVRHGHEASDDVYIVHEHPGGRETHRHRPEHLLP